MRPNPEHHRTPIRDPLWVALSNPSGAPTGAPRMASGARTQGQHPTHHTIARQQSVAGAHVVNPSKNLTYPTAHFSGLGLPNPLGAAGALRAPRTVFGVGAPKTNE